jgi:tRNA(Arg) A34 adenosine deaminase TadA
MGKSNGERIVITISSTRWVATMKSLNNFIENKKRLKDVDYMNLALEVATNAKSNGDVPVAAVLVWAGGRQLVEHDTRYSDHNPLNYAVLNVLNKAADTLGRKRLSEAVLYTNIEPNVMCALAMMAAGVKEVVFGAFDLREGFQSSDLLAAKLDIAAMGGVLGKESCDLLPESMQEHIRYE